MGFITNVSTCRHFRFELPRELADELRDADPEPCPVCDALPHRQNHVQTEPLECRASAVACSVSTPDYETVYSQSPRSPSHGFLHVQAWFNRLRANWRPHHN